MIQIRPRVIFGLPFWISSGWMFTSFIYDNKEFLLEKTINISISCSKIQKFKMDQKFEISVKIILIFEPIFVRSKTWVKKLTIEKREKRHFIIKLSYSKLKKNILEHFWRIFQVLIYIWVWVYEVFNIHKMPIWALFPSDSDSLSLFTIEKILN